MNSGKLIFSQVMDFLPLHTLLSGKTLYLSRPIFLHGLRSTNISREPSRYRSMPSLPTAQTLSHGHEKRRISFDTRRGQRTKRLAHICRFCIFLNPDCRKALQQRTLRSRPETGGLCSGCHDNRPLPLSVCFHGQTSSEPKAQ